jgi:hypothetical protein
LVFGSSACWIQRSRLDVPACTVRLRGLRDRSLDSPWLYQGWSILSCPWLRVQSSTRSRVPGSSRLTAGFQTVLPWDFFALRRIKIGAATSTGDSMSRLCNAFRFSQPLDALLRSKPFQPCFMLVAPMGFNLQRFPLRGSVHRLSAIHVLLAVSPVTSHKPRLRGFLASVESVAPSSALSVTWRSIRSWPSPLRGLYLFGLGSSNDSGTSFLGLRRGARRPKPPITPFALQSFREPKSPALLFREGSSLPGVAVRASCTTSGARSVGTRLLLLRPAGQDNQRSS